VAEKVTLDTSTERGRHVAQRLREDVIAWLTTVRPSGQPDNVPVWFYWDGESILIYSRPDNTKVHNLAQNPRVSVALDNTNNGGDVIRIEGVAERVTDAPPATDVPAFVEKYGERIAYIGYDPAGFAAAYSAAIRVTPTKYRV
jgi:PPOX class probable F420-dependent enzyme